jgi:hypothetical protein
MHSSQRPSASLVFLALLGALVACRPEPAPLTAEQEAFIDLMQQLPVDGEFFSEEGVNETEPFIDVLFSMSEGNLAGYGLYPFVALSRGLADRPQTQAYAVEHFEEIVHPQLKLGWAMILFNEDAAPREVIVFLQNALEDRTQSNIAAEMGGPTFEDFESRVRIAYEEQ